MTLYCDVTREPECVGVCMTDGTEVVFTGTEVHAEPPEYRTLPLAVRLAEECDVHFRFGDETWEPPFYTVPGTVVFARDSRGGYFAAADHPALDWSGPLYYIDGGLVCHRLTPAGKNLADAGESWRQIMVISGEVQVFPDRAAAEQRYRILTLQELLEEAK